MTLAELRTRVHLGEDSTRQFKADVRNGESLAAELAAFANSDGGTIFLGVADDGALPGLDRESVRRVNQLIGNAASLLVRSPLVVSTENVALENGGIVIVVRVPKGLDKPHFDKNGVIWLKVGADKRRVNTKEELRRFFQMSDQFHADELPTGASLADLDLLRFRDFLRDVYDELLPELSDDRLRLLQNLNLATNEGALNLGGLLLFGERPERHKPQFTVKAVRYAGTAIHTTDYVDTQDFHGPLRRVYDDALAFILRNLHRRQAGRGVNAPGTLEIPALVFEELLVNALVHRDYLINAPIRLFVFDDRVEIINPGHLPNHLTVAKIRAGNSVIRNPILASFVAKGVLPYRGMGTGVRRAVEAWPAIEFINDPDSALLTTVVRRPEGFDTDEAGAGSVETDRPSVEPEDAAAPPSVETDRPSVETERPSVETERPSVETERPSVETERPSVEPEDSAAPPSVETVRPSVEPEHPGEPPSVETGGPSVEVGDAEEAATAQRVLDYLADHPTETLAGLARALGRSTRAIEMQTANLRAKGRLRHVGPRKGGRWEVIG